MKILKHGKFYADKIIFDCTYCGCKFEVEIGECESFYGSMGRYERIYTYYCPECGSETRGCHKHESEMLLQ